MNIYKRELKAHYKSLLIWSAGIMFLVVAGMGKYSAGAAAGQDSMNDLMKQMPQSLQNLFGVGVFDLSVPIEFFAIMMMYILLIAGVHGVMLGAGIISKEERDKTAEFLLVKPVSRSRIIRSKLLAAVTLQAVLFLATYAACIGILSKFSDISEFSTELSKFMASMAAIQLLFLAVGAFFAGLLKDPKKSAAAGTSVLMVMFIFSIVADIVEKANFLKYFSFFKYFDAKDILVRGYSMVYPVISAVIVVVLIYGAFYFYKRRDMKI